MKNRFETFVIMINQINRSIQVIKNHEMEKYGLKGTHVMCLYQLKQHEDGITSKELAELCGEDKAAISRTLAKLEAKGLVAFVEEVGKKRYRTSIVLTEEGNKICEKVNQTIEDMVHINGLGYSDEEREIFYRVLAEIATNLNHTSNNQD